MRAGLAGVILLAAPAVRGAVAGSISGSVTDERGIGQIGAVVTLLDAAGRSLRRVYTTQTGDFLMDDLFPGFYGVRVTVPRFLPALRERILVEPGIRRLVAVQLVEGLASMRLVYPAEGNWRDMSEDWKWVLRSAASTRPILRLTAWEDQERQRVVRRFSGRLSGMFAETKGLVRLSAGDRGGVSGFGTESDLGTAFAVATSLFGQHNLLVSGNLGYGLERGAPSAGFRTSYRRELAYGAQPEISLTVRQLFLPVQSGQALFGPLSQNTPVLQTFSVGFQDRLSLGDLVELEYGFLYDAVRFLDRLDYLSPFGKLSYRLGSQTQALLRYSSGVPRPESAFAGENALGRSLTALGLYPRMSVLRGRPSLQRGEHMEMAVQQVWRGGQIELAAYRDGFSNAAVTALLPGSLYAAGDALPDLFSHTSSFNAGAYETTGYRVSYSRRMTESVTAGVAYGLSGVLTPVRESLASEEAGELRSVLKPVREQTVTAQLSAQLPQARTWIHSSYQWGNQEAVTAPDPFNASETRALPGMNLLVRQPLPQTSYLPGRFEATAELRNLLAQGYFPMRLADGRRLFLIQSARSFRGSVNFVF